MTEKLIDSFEELIPHWFQRIPGSPHTRWVPWSELKPLCTPRYIAQHERQHREFMEQYARDHAAHIRRYLYVTRTKQRARRRRR